MLSSMKLLTVQLPWQPHTLKRKFLSIVLPSGVWATSGWNCSPKKPWPFPITAVGQMSVYASEAKPGGIRATRSPWLIQTGIEKGRYSRSAESMDRWREAWPCSRGDCRTTVPPSWRAMACIP